jgi:hypothetical protein
VKDYERQAAWSKQTGDDSVPLAKLMTGTHIYAAAFGADVHVFDDTNPCALPFVSHAADADRIAEPDLWKSPTLYRVFELARAVQDELGKDVFLGPCDVQTGFDTLCLLWDKTSLYCAMLLDEEKEAVKRLAAKCARLLATFLAELRREFPTMSPLHCPGCWCPPEMGPWVSNDECGAVSNEMFREFMLPELVDLSTALGGLGMHCCAAAEQHFAAFREIPGFYGFNRVAAGKGYEPLLEHLAGPDGPVHVLAWLDDETIARLAAEAPAGTRFIFQRFIENPAEGREWIERMRRALNRP